MGYVRDRWTDLPSTGGRRVHNARWGKGRRWQAVWTDAAGRRQAKACTAKDEAEKLIRDREGRQAASKPVPLDRWIRQWEKSQLHWSAGTRDAARRAMEVTILPSFKGETVQSLTRQTVQDAVMAWSERWASQTVRSRWQFLAGPMRQAVRDGLIDRSPCDGVRLPAAATGKLAVLTVEQVLAIADAMTPRLSTMVTVAAGTGMRSGELRGLTWDRISGRIITVDRQLLRGGGDPQWGPVKNHRPRTVLLGDAAAGALKVQRERFGDGMDGLVWHSRTGRKMDPRSASGAWTRATRGMGLWPRSGWHDLRHFHASLLIAAGMSPRAVADRLGHVDVAETLRTYAHLWPTDSERMAAVFDQALSDKGASRKR